MSSGEPVEKSRPCDAYKRLTRKNNYAKLQGKGEGTYLFKRKAKTKQTWRTALQSSTGHKNVS